MEMQRKEEERIRLELIELQRQEEER